MLIASFDVETAGAVVRIEEHWDGDRLVEVLEYDTDDQVVACRPGTDVRLRWWRFVWGPGDLRSVSIEEG